MRKFLFLLALCFVLNLFVADKVQAMPQFASIGMIEPVYHEICDYEEDLAWMFEDDDVDICTDYVAEERLLSNYMEAPSKDLGFFEKIVRKFWKNCFI